MRSHAINFFTSLGLTERNANLCIRLLAVFAFAFATAIAAQVRVPLPGTPVPVTLQTAIVLLAGLSLGSRDGAFSQALYIACGALGLPFFAGKAGLAALVGPTGGYLIGFVLAAWFAGFANERFNSKKGFLRAWVITFVASMFILVPGLIQLKLFMQLNWAQAVVMGFIPFLFGDVVKVTFAATAHSLTRRRM